MDLAGVIAGALLSTVVVFVGGGLYIERIVIEKRTAEVLKSLISDTSLVLTPQIESIFKGWLQPILAIVPDAQKDDKDVAALNRKQLLAISLSTLVIILFIFVLSRDKAHTMKTLALSFVTTSVVLILFFVVIMRVYNPFDFNYIKRYFLQQLQNYGRGVDYVQ